MFNYFAQKEISKIMWNKRALLAVLAAFFACTLFAQDTGLLLPEDFKVYVRNDMVINHPASGFKEKVLPTRNHYKGPDGGYVAIYTKQKKGSVYSVGGGIYVLGQIRLKGRYYGRVFYPDGYSEGDDITQDVSILKICDSYFPEFKGRMWIGGDTGGWFGVQ